MSRTPVRGGDVIEAAIQKNLRRHLNVATADKPELRTRIASGNYAFSELDGGHLLPVGTIFCPQCGEHDNEQTHDGNVATNGSVRYGDCLAVPDGRGVVYFIFLGLHDNEGHDYTIAAVLMPEEATMNRVRSELERMWNHRHVNHEGADTYAPVATVSNFGPGLDCTKREAAQAVGHINRWFTENQTTNRVRVGDFAETRLKQGADKGKDVRIEAVDSGFMAFVSTDRNDDGEPQDWRMLWQSPSLSEALDFAASNDDNRHEYIHALTADAELCGGVLRYLNGSLYGFLSNEESMYVVRDWMVFEITQDDTHDMMFNPSLEVRDALGFCA